MLAAGSLGTRQHAMRSGATCRPTCATRGIHARRLQHVAPPSAASAGAGAFPSLSPQLDTSALSDFKVLVAGATGGVGKRVVEVLVEQNVPVRALVRDTYKAKATLPTSSGLVDIFKADVTQYATLPGALGDSNAIIICTGSSDIKDPFAPYNLHQGVANLVALATLKKVKKIILVTSIGTDDIINPLNLFWGVLFWKKREEEIVQRSGISYTIVRPGGLKDALASGQAAGNVVVRPAGYYGLPPANRVKAGNILRRQVAEVCVAALTEPAAADKVVEIIAEKDAPQLSYTQLFEGVSPNSLGVA